MSENAPRKVGAHPFYEGEAPAVVEYEAPADDPVDPDVPVDPSGDETE